jgi:hypothetical protein
MKRIYLRLALLLVLLGLAIGIQYLLAFSDAALRGYVRYVFLPLQRLRSWLFNELPFSMGDLLYVGLCLVLLLLLFRSLYYLVRMRQYPGDFWRAFLRLIRFPVILYLWFLLLWGGNYARKPLSVSWTGVTEWNDSALYQLTHGLVLKLNNERRQVVNFPNLKKVNQQAAELYRQRFGSQLPAFKVKPTSLGYMLNYLGIQGYYNPLTGEAQFNRFIPDFMHPFVVCHEMAHQAGIAAEDDANLLAYIIGAESELPAFRYSAFFNLFVYAYSGLKARDSAAASEIFALLNPQSRNDLETLRRMNQKYRSGFRRISSSLYDDYLRFHGQREGIGTYSDVTRWVYYWEYTNNKKAQISLEP